MGFDKIVEIGRVAYISKGKGEGKLAAIVDVLDQNKGLIDGPQIPRQVASFQNLQLTKFRIKIPHTAKHKAVVKQWEDAGIAQKWEDSNWAKKLDRQKKRENMSDFDRFKLMRAKQARNRIIKLEFGKLKRLSSKSAAKKPAAKGGKQAAKKK